MIVRTLPLWAGLGALLTLLVAPAFGQGVTAGSDLKIMGYVQNRLVVPEDGDMSFTTNRAYVRLDATTGKDTGFGFLYSAAPGDGVLEAFGRWTVDEKNTLRVGLYHTPFGLEAPMSSAKLATLDRAEVVNQLVYYPWSFDKGITWDHAMGKNGTLCVALTNGEEMDGPLPESGGDDNNAKNLTARFGKTSGKTAWGVSGMLDGDTKLYGVDFQTKQKALAIWGEAIMADWGCGCDDAQGFYVTAAKDMKNDLQPYVRFEMLDGGHVSSDFTRVTAGVNKAINPLTRVTLEAQYADTDDYEPETRTPSVSDGLTFQAQWQASF